MDKPNYCESVYKGKNEEEIKKGLNQKWIEIINCCMLDKVHKNTATDYQKSNKHSIAISTTNQLVSANLEKEELNKL